MKWGRLFLGVATGLCVGYFLVRANSKPYLPPEFIVESLKAQHKDQFQITGSWIHAEPESELINGIPYAVYECGLIKLIDGEPHQIEFLVDAETGSILHSSPA